jgi:hypothetical protein
VAPDLRQPGAADGGGRHGGAGWTPSPSGSTWSRRDHLPAVTVALGGDGGDELFAGVDRYVGPASSPSGNARIPGPLRRQVLSPAACAPSPRASATRALATKLRLAWTPWPRNPGWNATPTARPSSASPTPEAGAVHRGGLAGGGRRARAERLLAAFLRRWGPASTFLGQDAAYRLRHAPGGAPAPHRGTAWPMAHSLEARKPLPRSPGGGPTPCAFPRRWQVKGRKDQVRHPHHGGALPSPRPPLAREAGVSASRSRCGFAVRGRG